MEALKTIQKRNKLNIVTVVDDAHPVNKGHHQYRVTREHPAGAPNLFNELTSVLEEIATIQFQNGPRNEPDSTSGVLDVDLLEIVRHRLTSFQGGPFATHENAIALTHIEEALLWMNKRVEDRAEAGTLGTNKI